MIVPIAVNDIFTTKSEELIAYWDRLLRATFYERGLLNPEMLVNMEVHVFECHRNVHHAEAHIHHELPRGLL